MTGSILKQEVIRMIDPLTFIALLPAVVLVVYLSLIHISEPTRP